jgi:hypothetical protein
VALGHVYSEYFGFPCQSSFHQILHPHNHLGQVQYARSGRRTGWTQTGLHPPLCEFKKRSITYAAGWTAYLIYLSSIYLWLYSHLLDLGRIFSFLIYIQLVGILGRGISQSQSSYTHTEQYKHRIHAHRRPCREWDWNRRSQLSSEGSSCFRPRSPSDQ